MLNVQKYVRDSFETRSSSDPSLCLMPGEPEFEYVELANRRGKYFIVYIHFC